MQEGIKKVEEFHKVSDHPILSEPGLPPNKRIDFRLSLLEEELKELEDAAYKRDIVAVLDALCDLQYVLNGAILEFGLQGIFEEAFNEVHASNMSKFCTRTDDAKESALRYMDKKIDAYYKKVGGANGVFVIYRSLDDKILKGIRYFEPRLKKLLEQHSQARKNNEK